MSEPAGVDRVKELPPRRGGVARSMPSDGAISRDLSAVKIKDGHKPYAFRLRIRASVQDVLDQ